MKSRFAAEWPAGQTRFSRDILVNGDDLAAIAKNPVAIVDVFSREAVHAMRLKTIEL